MINGLRNSASKIVGSRATNIELPNEGVPRPRKNSLKKMILEDQILKVRKSSLKKITLESQVLKKRKYHLDLPIIQNISAKRNLIILKLFQKKRIINMVVKRSLNIETGLKSFLLKNAIDPDNSVKANNTIR